MKRLVGGTNECVEGSKETVWKQKPANVLELLVLQSERMSKVSV